MSIPLKHLSSRADSTASSQVDPTSRRNSSVDESRGASREDARSVRSGHSVKSGNVPIVNASVAAAGPGTGPVSFEQDSQPRLVGLSQPFFASTAPLDSPNSQAAAMQRVEAEATKGGKKIKVLVAEDNTTNQIVVMRMLKLEDVYDVTVAKDGQEALDRVKESMEAGDPYNLIFMDVQMPNMDGLDSTRLIRQSGFSAPIVALTAYAEESNVKQCMESGMDFFLSKPIRRPALKHVLKTYCPPIVEEDEGGDKTPPKNSPNPAAPPQITTTVATGPTKGPFSIKAGPGEHVESPAISPGTT